MASISASLHIQARPDIALQSISPLKVRFYSKAALSLPISPFKGVTLKSLVPQKKQQLQKFKISAVKASPNYLVLAVEYGPTVKFVKIDTDEEYELAQQLQIRGLPTMVFISPDSQKAAIRTEGLLPNETIKTIIETEL